MTGLQAGVATREVTPDPGDDVPMAGYGYPPDRLATDVHDPLHARALVVGDGGTAVGLLAVDVLGLPATLCRQVEGRVTERTDLDAVVLAATHTHAGPYLPGRPSRYPVETDVSGYVERIREGCIAALTAAAADRRPATLRVGHATCDAVPENRRALGGVNGTVRVPDGPVDPEVTVLDVAREGGDDALLYNLACHPVCTTPDWTRLSADWPGHVAAALEDTTLFLNGAAGDINPRDRYAADRDEQAVVEYLTDVGEEVATAVRAARADARERDGTTDVPVTAERRTLRLPTKATPDAATLEDQLERVTARLEAIGGGRDGGTDEDTATDGEATDPWRDHYAAVGSEAARLRGDRLLLHTLGAIERWGGDHLPVTLTRVSVGVLDLVTLPGEPFVQHGLDLKAAADGPLVVAGYADAYVSYLPTLAAFDAGGYETDVGFLAPEAVPQVRAAALELLA